MRLATLLFGLIAIGCGRTNEIAADDETGGSAGSGGSPGSGGKSQTGGSGNLGGGGGLGGTGAAGSGGVGAAGGSGGAAGSGGSGGSVGIDLTHYHACELPTGMIRWGLFKADPARDLCFEIVVGIQSPEFPAIKLTPSALGVESAHVWKGASSCGDFPFPTGAVNANGGSGWISQQQTPVYPTVVDMDVTITFPQTQSWVPASENFKPSELLELGLDCASCNQKADAYAKFVQASTKPGGGPNACTSVVRLDFAQKKPVSHAIVCDVYNTTSEAKARASVEAQLNLAPGSALLSGPSTDQWVFRGPVKTAIPEADRVAAAVSVRTGLIGFGATIGWFTTGSVKAPATWKSAAELGGGCTALPKPSVRGFTLLENPKKVELDPPELAQVTDAVWATALPQGILKAWGNSAFDAVVLMYPPKLGFDEKTAEYGVLVNHGWLE